jgi:hypothetical protein
MEIEFNPSRIPKPDPGQPVARSGDSSAASSPESVPQSASLQSKLNDLPLIRPEKVASASALVSDSNYPPGYIVDRIAALLALHINNNK